MLVFTLTRCKDLAFQVQRSRRKEGPALYFTEISSKKINKDLSFLQVPTVGRSYFAGSMKEGPEFSRLVVVVGCLVLCFDLSRTGRAALGWFLLQVGRGSFFFLLLRCGWWSFPSPFFLDLDLVLQECRRRALQGGRSGGGGGGGWSFRSGGWSYCFSLLLKGFR